MAKDEFIMTRLKRHQVDDLDKMFPGIPRWKQVDQLARMGSFSITMGIRKMDEALNSDSLVSRKKKARP
jgi:hypothetical protein